MEISNSKGYADLQAVMAIARQRNPALAGASEDKVSTAQKTGAAQNTARISKGIAEASVQSGKLIERFYTNTAKKQEASNIRVGSRFDAYA